MINENIKNQCSLTPDAFSERLAWINESLLSRATSQNVIQDGSEIEFPSDETTFQMVIDFIKAERQCCDFLTFELVVAAGHGPLTLRLKEGGG